MRPKALRRFPWATLGRAEMPEEFFEKIAQERNLIELLPDQPKFSLVCDLETESGKHFAPQTWESLLLQSYPNWEVLIIGSESWKDSLHLPDDPRFHWVGEVSVREAFVQTQGEWVGRMAVGDVLSPSAFFQVLQSLKKAETVVGVYSNEVRMEGSEPKEFFSKCAWSPLTLRNWNYIGRFWLLRAERLVLPPEDLPFEEHAALLKAGEYGDFVHVPYYLYYRRAKGWLHSARHDKTVIASSESGEAIPLTTAIICFRDKAKMTLDAVRALVALRGDAPLEIVLVDNGSREKERVKIEAFLSTVPIPIRLVGFPGPFNFARMNNWAVKEHAQGEQILFLNNDVKLTRGNLSEWVKWAREPRMGTVGILLRFAHGGVQHSGIRAWFGGEARLVRVGNSHAEDPVALSTREVYANTFAACLVPKKVFEALGGLKETECVNGFGDVAFCFKALRRGYHHLFLGSVEGVHAESSSRGRPYEYWEEFAIERDYPEILQRLLREDLGLNRIPGADDAVGAFLFRAAKTKFRSHSSWLNPAKPALKKWLRIGRPAGDTA